MKKKTGVGEEIFALTYIIVFGLLTLCILAGMGYAIYLLVTYPKF